ncbi:MAG: MoxR family ATPase [Myxococcales bacterium]|nr:MAG: MoxR family ATPase [Myxococcales bacterium]
MYNEIEILNQKIKRESAFIEPLVTEIRKWIVGQTEMVEKILVGLLADGHILLEGVPGLAKTKAINAVARAIDAGFQRLQFTPDLLPADLVGTMIYNQATGQFTPKKGPIFTNIVLADEINRSPAKVQSALLEAMQEKQVTIGDQTYPLPTPFFVLATQNPIEQEGTYPLPEAQVDRFLFKVKVGYPSREEERQIMERNTAQKDEAIKAAITPEQLLRAREVVREIYVDDSIKTYILNIVFATRKPEANGPGGETERRKRFSGPPELYDLLEYGASPRATIYLNLAARARAFLKGRGYVTGDDVKSVAYDVLRHRLIPTYEAEARELLADDLVRMVLDFIQAP